MTEAEYQSHPIRIKKAHEGLLHEETGVAENKIIPMADLLRKKRSRDPAVRSRATFALNARHWHHKGRKAA